jgi:diketogulonate reductase-like aldo/keto reductase
MTLQPKLRLSDGHDIPQLGFGVWQIGKDEAAGLVRQAIEAGYRLIDSAAIYDNEEGVGAAVRSAGVPRAELFVTTKLWNDRHGFDSALRAFDESMARLKLDYVDLYLIHWPAPRRNAYVESWRALIRLRKEGRARSIGVSNFNADEIQRLVEEMGVAPVLNQVELHPFFQQTPLRSFHASHGIATEAWSPLGKGRILENAALRAIAAKHGRTVGQIILRWHLENGIIAIPKTATPARMRENLDILGFQLDADDLARIAELDQPNGRVGPSPTDMAF